MSEVCTIEQGVCRYVQRVYFSDTDAGGIMYHSRYLDFTEHARTELLRLLGIEQSGSLRDAKTGFVVSSLSISYRSPAFLDDLVRVESVLDSCERFSLTLTQRMYREDVLLAEQVSKIGHLDFTSGRPVRISEEHRSRLLRVRSSDR